MRPALRDQIAARLGAPVEDVRAVGGGDINDAYVIRVGGQRLFVKSNDQPPPEMFAREASALRRLRAADAVRIPEVVAEGEGFLVLEWIETGRPGPGFGARFGAALAELHRDAPAEPARYGLDEDNFIGSLPQRNDWSGSWAAFYGERRIGEQLRIGEARGRLPKDVVAAGWSLVERMAQLVPDTPRPALLHGDLWSGNYLCDSAGQPVLIDPALYRGHREVELAFTELFGGFPSDFYAAYGEAWPLRPGYRERRDLYQLYPILVHANLFGGGYVSRARTLIRQYQ